MAEKNFKNKISNNEEQVKKKVIIGAVPALIVLFCASVVSWGAYMTSRVYTISAEYKLIIDERLKEDALNLFQMDRKFSNKILEIRKEQQQRSDHMDRRLDIFQKSMKDDMKEMKSNLKDIYNILIRNGYDSKK